MTTLWPCVRDMSNLFTTWSLITQLVYRTATARLAVGTTFHHGKLETLSISGNSWDTWVDNLCVFSVPRGFPVLESISSAIKSVPPNKSAYRITQIFNVEHQDHVYFQRSQNESGPTWKLDNANCFAQSDKIKKLHEKLAGLSLFTQHFCMPCFVFAKAVFLYCKIGNDLHISDLRDE